jgi:glycerol-3-phosphate acyltransferase PlsX
VAHIVIDSAAGQEGGREAIAAAAIASLDLDLQIVLVGDAAQITAELPKIAHDAERVRVVHAPDRLDPALDPHEALRQAPRSSVVVGIELTAQEADAVFISAGPPGPIVSQALRALGRLPGVQRAALAAVYPTLHHRGPNDDPFALLLDVGATIQCSADHLVAFAGMGAAYAAKISALERPRVALLSNGPSPAGAPTRVRDAHERLTKSAPAFEYVGMLRGDQVTLGEADVIVTDGFTGDVLVRTLEGIAATAETLLSRAEARFQWRMGMKALGGGIAKLRALTDWENYGGAPLLGVDRPVILTQAECGRRAFLNAIRLAAKMQRLAVVDAVAAGAAAMAQGERP